MDPSVPMSSPQTHVVSPPPKKDTLWTVVVIIFGIIFIALASWVAYVASKTIKPVNNRTESTIGSNKLTNTSLTDAAILTNPKNPLSDWEWARSYTCPAQLLLPPLARPYAVNISDDPTQQENESYVRYWRMRTKENAQPEIFTRSVVIAHLSPADPPSYKPSMVVIACQPNSQRIDTTELTNLYSDYLRTKNIEASVEKNETLWNRKVAIFSAKRNSFGSDIEYLFATPDYIYKIYWTSESTEAQINETTQRIFRNLSFSEVSSTPTVPPANVQP